MGAANSTPIWLQPKHATTGYDAWGYLPESGVAPQHDWSQLYDAKYGFPASGGIPQTSSDPHNPNWKAALWAGQQNDMLATFGNTASVTTPVTNVLTFNSNPSYTNVVNQFPSISVTAKSYNPNDDETVCTPLNYPNCSMTNMRNGAPVVAPYEGWWAGSGEPKYKDGNQSFTYNSATTGPAVDIFSRWIEKIDACIENYSNNNYSGLDTINTQDTSDYDPCDNPSLLDKLIPLAMAVAGIAVLRTYGSEFLVALPSATNGLIYGTVFITLEDIGKAVTALPSSVVSGRNPEQVSLYTQKAATALSVGSGAAVGSVIAINSGNSELLGIAAGGLVGKLLQPVAVKILIPAVASGSAASFIPILIFDYAAKFWCNISNWGNSACDDFGENNGGTSKGFPDARRWDVASVCAKLTDMACEEEGWTRDSEQAKFVYRGLILNPLWAQAATLTGEDTQWSESAAAVNPIGLLISQREAGGTDGNSEGWYQGWTVQADSFTGTNAAGADPVTDQNRFACQNWDIIFNADECTTGSTNDPCANNNDDYYKRDVEFAKNLKAWKKALIEASYDPNKLKAQHNIPGVANPFGVMHDPPALHETPILKVINPADRLIPILKPGKFDPFTPVMPHVEDDCAFWAKTTLAYLAQSGGLPQAVEYLLYHTAFESALTQPALCPSVEDFGSLLAVYYFGKHVNKDDALDALIAAPYSAPIVCVGLHTVKDYNELVNRISPAAYQKLLAALQKCNLSVISAPDKLGPLAPSHVINKLHVYTTPDHLVPGRILGENPANPLRTTPILHWLGAPIRETPILQPGKFDPFLPEQHPFQPLQADCMVWAQNALSILQTSGLANAYHYVDLETSFVGLVRNPNSAPCDDKYFGALFAIYYMGFFPDKDYAVLQISLAKPTFGQSRVCQALAFINEVPQLFQLLSAAGQTTLQDALSNC